jgi:uncharacterized protein
MIPRQLADVLVRAATQYPVVSLTGPRQSGKTTLVRAAFPHHAYVSLESPDHRAFAIEDPRGFLAQFPNNVILDEVQRTPDLFSYIQGIVDDENRPGQFVLTGSHNFLLLQSIRQTLAGRCSVLHLLPFARTELTRRPPMAISDIGRISPSPEDATDDWCDVLFKGSYPRIHDRNLDCQDWLRNYCETYLERDVRDIVHVGDIEAFSRFLRLCAGRCSQLLNLAALAADAGIAHSTARRWLSILEASFLVAILRPYHGNLNKRLVKSPKLYFLDTGLLCYLLRIRSADELRFHGARGAVFEAWVVSELLKNYYNRGAEPDVFFWRDSAGHEVDIVIEHEGRQIVVEIKSGETVADDFFKTLRYWRKLPGQVAAPAALVYGGKSSFMRDGVAVRCWDHWG